MLNVSLLLHFAGKSHDNHENYIRIAGHGLHFNTSVPSQLQTCVYLRTQYDADSANDMKTDAEETTLHDSDK